MDIILFLGRQGLTYRGSEEGSHSLDNCKVNHGKFLETVLLVAEYDPILKKHVMNAFSAARNTKQDRINRNMGEVLG